MNGKKPRRMQIARVLISLGVGVVAALGVPFLPLHMVFPDRWLSISKSYRVEAGPNAFWLVTRTSTWNITSDSSVPFRTHARADSERQRLEDGHIAAAQLSEQDDIHPPEFLDRTMALHICRAIGVPDWTSFRAFDPRPFTASTDPECMDFHAGDVGYGWPFVSLTGVSISRGGPTGVTMSMSGMVQVGGALIVARPYWPGLLANVVVYFVPAYALIYLGLYIRNARRVRRGLCRECAYDLRGLDGAASCPECGDATRKR